MQTKRRNNNNNTSSFLESVQSFEGLSNKKMMMQHQHPNDDSYGPTICNMSFGTHSSSLAATTILKSQADGMAASFGNAFTGSQWRELEIQVMIYKYLVASLPVPSYLLSSIPTSSMIDGGFNTRLSSSRNGSTDPEAEAGRCRRTDGKKWRCSRYVAPNNKYCERHMHRGSYRSRKPVELHTNEIKRIPNPTTRKYAGTSSQFLASTAFHPYLQPPLSLDNSSFGVKLVPSFDPSNKQPRVFELMPNGDPIPLAASNSGWNSLMHNNMLGMTNESLYLNNNTESHYLNSFLQYSSELSQQETPFSLLFNPLVVPIQTLQTQKPRGFSFIDTWSNVNTVENNANNNTSAGKLSLSSLDISMGGPLAEVLRPSNITSISDSTSSNPSSSVTTNRVESIGTSGATMLSSPSGVFHNKTLTSFSDSSSNSSPTCIIKTQF